MPSGLGRVPAARGLTVVAALAAGACTLIGACTPAPARSAHADSGAPVAAARPRGVPGCTTATARAPQLGASRTVMLPAGGGPFGITAAPDGRWVFVSGLQVWRTGSRPPLTLARTIPTTIMPVGQALTRDGRYLLAAAGSGAAVFSVAAAERGGPHAELGLLTSPGGGSAIETAVSRDGGYAFVSLEGQAEIAVFSLRRALSTGFGAADYLGAIPVGIAPVGLAVSPDGRWLYATSELAGRAIPTSAAGRRAALGGQGTLSVISVTRAGTDPAHAVAATLDAGCQPVRVITSADGRVVWVTWPDSSRLAGSPARWRSSRARNGWWSATMSPSNSRSSTSPVSPDRRQSARRAGG